MESAFKSLARIKKEFARGKRPAVFSDFDGSLAPIVARPSSAHLSKQTRRVLQKLSMRFPVAVISGRDLADIEARIGIPGIICAGSHGLEWTMDGRRRVKRAASREIRSLAQARAALLSLAPRFAGLIIEDKRFTFALNYRALPPKRAREFAEAAHAAAEPHRKHLRVFDELCTFEVMPHISWNKGECARSILYRLERTHDAKFFPVYLGDSLTDEDAFRALRRGVTIYIGTGKSAARYCLPRRSVNAFLEALLALPKEGKDGNAHTS